MQSKLKVVFEQFILAQATLNCWDELFQQYGFVLNITAQTFITLVIKSAAHYSESLFLSFVCLVFKSHHMKNMFMHCKNSVDAYLCK